MATINKPIRTPTPEAVCTYFANTECGKKLLDQAAPGDGLSRFNVQLPDKYSEEELQQGKVFLETIRNGQKEYVSQSNLRFIQNPDYAHPLEIRYAVISVREGNSPPNVQVLSENSGSAQGVPASPDMNNPAELSSLSKGSFNELTNENQPIGCWQRLSVIWTCVVRAFKALLNCFCCCRSKQEPEPSKLRQAKTINLQKSENTPLSSEPIPFGSRDSVLTTMPSSQPTATDPSPPSESNFIPVSTRVESPPSVSTVLITNQSTPLSTIPDVVLDNPSPPSQSPQPTVKIESLPLFVSSSSSSQSSSTTSIQSTSSTQKASTQPPTLVSRDSVTPVKAILNEKDIQQAKILFIIGDPGIKGKEDFMGKITQTEDVMEKIKPMLQKDPTIIPFAFCNASSFDKSLRLPAPSGQVRILLKPELGRLQSNEWNNTTTALHGNYTIVFESQKAPHNERFFRELSPTAYYIVKDYTIPLKSILIDHGKSIVLENDNLNNANTRNALNAMILEKLS